MQFSGDVNPRTVVQSFAYDDYDRLIQAEHNYLGDDELTETFEYDYAGNITGKNKSFSTPAKFDPGKIGVITSGTSYGIDNRPVDQTRMNFDDFGNVNYLFPVGKDNPLNFTYTQFNQVETIIEGTNKFEFTYDGEGKRVMKKIFVNDDLQEIWVFVRGVDGKVLEELKKVKKDDGSWTDWLWAKDYYYFGDKLISSASAQ